MVTHAWNMLMNLSSCYTKLPAVFPCLSTRGIRARESMSLNASFTYENSPSDLHFEKLFWVFHFPESIPVGHGLHYSERSLSCIIEVRLLIQKVDYLKGSTTTNMTSSQLHDLLAQSFLQIQRLLSVERKFKSTYMFFETTWTKFGMYLA